MRKTDFCTAGGGNKIRRNIW